MFGPNSILNSSSSLSSFCSSSASISPSNLSFNLSNKMARNKVSNNLIQVYFANQDRPILSVISSGLKSNTIKVYKCLNTVKCVLIKIEKNRIYRLTGPKLISIPINNIDVNWQLVCSYTNLNELQIKELYIDYRVK